MRTCVRGPTWKTRTNGCVWPTGAGFNGLGEQALAEIQAAVELRPDHAETRRLLQHLRQAALTPAAPKAVAPVR